MGRWKGDVKPPLADRFRAKVAKAGPDECWLWTGAAYGRCYGGFQVDNDHYVGAHRVAYELHTGQPVPSGLFVCHRCDVPRCCNPAHLFLGTHKENMADMAAKGRSNGKLKPEEALAAKYLYLEYGWKHRQIAERFKVSVQVVRNVLAGETYRYLPPPT